MTAKTPTQRITDNTNGRAPRVRLTGLLGKLTIGGDPAALTVTVNVALDEQNVDMLLLLADWKRHGGPLNIDLTQAQLPLPIAGEVH